MVNKLLRPISSKFSTLNAKLKNRYPIFATLWFRSLMVTLSLLILLPSVTIIVDNMLKNRTYTLSADVTALVGKSTVDTTLIKTTDTAFTYNRAEESNAPEDIQKVLEIAGKKEDATGKKPYQAELAKDANDGITFSDSEGDRSFKLVPQHNTANARLDDEGRVIYPNGSNEKHIYSFKTNGIKSDIVLTETPKDTTKDYTWELQLGSQLEARMLPDGGVGIYSADPTLFGENLQIGDQKSQDLIDKARKNGAKNTLAFELPKPFIVDANNNKNYEDANYTLKNNTLTLQTRNLQNQSYPLTIDPTIVVTTTSNFNQKTGNTGNTDFGTDGQINRGEITNGATGAYTATASFATARSGHTTVAYNGYLYVLGGSHAVSDTACHTVADTYCSDVQYATINSDGTVGTWHYTHDSTDDGTTFVSGFTTARPGHTSVAYNGYLYVIGGGAGISSYNDVQYAPINADGTVGSWGTTTSSLNTRYLHSTVTYNGYIYIVGGGNFGGALNDVQYAPINADGTIGTWHYTHDSTDDGTTFVSGFTTARTNHTSVAYNGYLYIIGGAAGSNLNDVQYAPINANGTVGAWTATTSFTTARTNHTSVAYSGYLYVIGGIHATSDTACNSTASNYCSDVQYAPINTDGTVGAWTATTSFSTARSEHTSVAYNGYLYVIGGYNGSGQSSVQYAKITPGASSQYTSTTTFATIRTELASVVYNGYMYVLGGFDGTNDLANVQYAYICDGTTTGGCTAGAANIGKVGTWAATTSYTTGRSELVAIAHKGYMYVISGFMGTAGLNDVQYAYICDGTATLGCTAGAANIGKLGTWAATTSFSVVRTEHSAVIYNGYMYVMGGFHAASDTACNGTASNYCSDVQYAYICDGTTTGGCTAGAANIGKVGTWNPTTNFTTARSEHTSVAYNGYMYVMGGYTGSTGLNDVQYAQINSNGTLGTWATTNSFAVGRTDFTTVTNNGYLYVIGGFHATSDTACHSTSSQQCSDVQYATINTDGSVSTWKYAVSFSPKRTAHASVVYNGYLYLISGYNGSLGTNTVQFARIGQNNNINTWGITSSFATGRDSTASVAYNGYIYVSGGSQAATDTACNPTASNICSDVQYAYICDGTATGGCTAGSANVGKVGTWAPTTSMPTPLYGHKFIAFNGYVYVVGGYKSVANTSCSPTSSNFCSTIMYALICNGANNGVAGCGATAGTLGTWDLTSSFATPRSDNEAFVYNGYMYVIGGYQGAADTDCNTTSSSYCSDVQYAIINSNGTVGTWYATSSFPVARNAHTSVAYGGYLYVLGGNDGSVRRSDVLYAKINSDGTVSNWKATSSFTTARQSHVSVAFGGYLYVIGGAQTNWDIACHTVATGSCSDVQFARINNDGSLEPWTTSNNRLATPRYGHGIAVYNNYIYAVGGGNNPAYLNSVEYSPVLTNSYSAHYERFFDTGSAGNTINSFTIQGSSPKECKYSITYKTAGSDGVLGSSSTIKNVTPGVTQALNTSLKQYVYLAATMDDSTCGEQSNITSISLDYNASPSAPALLLPAINATAINTLPEFRLGSSDDTDYIQYKIELCTTSNCSSVLRTINQAVSAVGWTSQSQNSGTAYAGGSTSIIQYGIHQYQPTALSGNTQYWWRAQAIDPGGTNQWSAYSTIYTFTTGAALPPAQMNIGGGTTIYGGTNFSTGN